jgi:hypothetical protein
MEEKKEKEDALNYSLAKNDLITADLLEREKLLEDQDHATHNERYEAGFNAAQEALNEKYPTLSQHDRAILDAEADMIRTRGGIAVRAHARGIDIDQGYARFIGGLEEAKENLMKAEDFATRNAVMEGVLQSIKAARAQGYIQTDEEEEILRQATVQEFATASIDSMSDEDQIAILTDSLARRRGYGDDPSDERMTMTIEESDQRVRDKRAAAGLPEYPEGVSPGDRGSPYQADFEGGVSEWGRSVLESQGRDPSGVGPVSAEDVQSGQRGNVGDFLHADTAAKMLTAALSRDKENRTRIEAQDAAGLAEQIYPEDPEAQLEWVQNNTEGSVEESASRMVRQRIQDEENAEIDWNRAINSQYSELMRTDENFTYDNIPTEVLGDPRMRESTKRDLEAFQKSLGLKRGGFAANTVWSTPVDDDGKRNPEDGNSWSLWDSMSDEEKLKEDLDSAAWMGVLEKDVWLVLKAEHEELRNPTAPTQAIIQNDKDIFTELMAGGVGGSGPLLPRTGRTEEEDGIWSRELFRFRDRVGVESRNNYGGGAVPYEVRRDILLKMLGEKAWVRDASDFDDLEAMSKGRYWFGDDLDFADAIPAASMTDEMRSAGFIHYQVFENENALVNLDGVVLDNPIPWPELLTNESKKRWDGKVPEQKDMENAMYAMQQNMPLAEVLRRLKGGGEY